MSERSLARIKALRTLPALAIACHAEAMERALADIESRLTAAVQDGDSTRVVRALAVARETIAYRAKIHEGLEG